MTCAAHSVVAVDMAVTNPTRERIVMDVLIGGVATLKVLSPSVFFDRALVVSLPTFQRAEKSHWYKTQRHARVLSSLCFFFKNHGTTCSFQGLFNF